MQGGNGRCNARPAKPLRPSLRSDTSPRCGEAQTVEKGAPSPWPPLGGGSARRRWGRELYGCPKYFEQWQCSLPPPLRDTSPRCGKAFYPAGEQKMMQQGSGILGVPLVYACRKVFFVPSLQRRNRRNSKQIKQEKGVCRESAGSLFNLLAL